MERRRWRLEFGLHGSEVEKAKNNHQIPDTNQVKSLCSFALGWMGVYQTEAREDEARRGCERK